MKDRLVGGRPPQALDRRRRRRGDVSPRPAPAGRGGERGALPSRRRRRRGARRTTVREQRGVRYTLLGRTGVRVSGLCLGTAFLGIAPLEADAPRLVARAVDAGVNFLDTANSYGNQTRFDRPGIPPAADRPSSEELVGRGVRGRRHEVVIATKVQERVGDGPNDGGPAGGGLTRRHIVAPVRAQSAPAGDGLHRRLLRPPPGPDHPARSDPARVRRPRASGQGPLPGPLQLPRLGADPGALARRPARLDPPVAMEMPYNLVDRGVERDVVPACLALGVSITAYSALAEGLLTGRYTPAGEGATAGPDGGRPGRHRRRCARGRPPLPGGPAGGGLPPGAAGRRMGLPPGAPRPGLAVQPAGGRAPPSSGRRRSVSSTPCCPPPIWSMSDSSCARSTASTPSPGRAAR